MKRAAALAFAIGISVIGPFLCAEPLRIDSLEAIEVNGSRQWVLIRGSDPANPVLLYLHGGPGHSMIPFAHAATGLLTDRFTVVYWDQRGTGLSYGAAEPAETVSIGQLVDDTLAVTKYLKERFEEEKLYLLGHSWVSAR